ncbi:MAG: non-heme iron oxygenase ferredoxin subunit [Candidatus Omnitrophota bacterium]
MSKTIIIGKKSDIPIGKSISVDIEGKKVAVFNVGGKYYAIGDECTHAGASLSEGSCEGEVVTCPWHGAKFSLTNGAALEAPAFEGVATYRIVLNGDDVAVEV